MKPNGYQLSFGLIKDIFLIIGIIVSVTAFALETKKHTGDTDVHLDTKEEQAMLDFMFNEDLPGWKHDVDTELELRDTKVKEIVRETVKELKEEGYLK